MSALAFSRFASKYFRSKKAISFRQELAIHALRVFLYLLYRVALDGLSQIVDVDPIHSDECHLGRQPVRRVAQAGRHADQSVLCKR